MSYLSARREVGEFRKRYRWMALFALLIFLIIVGRIVQLQIIDQDKYRAIATSNITKTISLPATRGRILDSTGREVATNRPAYRLYITPYLFDMERDFPRLVELMSLDDKEAGALKARLDSIPDHRRTQRIEFFKELTRDQVATLETHAMDLLGVDVVVVPVRTYLYGSLGAHAIGYVNEVSAEDLERFPDQGYKSGDRIGRIGIERSFERELRGRKGFRQIVVDARGRIDDRHFDIDSESHRDPKPGLDVQLTLDMKLMQIIDREFRLYNSGGAAVVEVSTGRLRALYSKPAYDLNEISGGLSVERNQELNENPYRPRIDKTIYESYFPGSTLKPVVALAGLREGLIDEHTKVVCHGYYTLGKDKKRCTQVHGEVDLRSALSQSCNVLFYQLAEKLGLDKISQYAKEFGLGRRTGVRINTETKGFFPTRSWYAEQYKTPFRVGYTLNEAIGQGNTRVTLVQLAMIYAAIANGGTLYRPQLVRKVSSVQGRTIRKMSPSIRARLDFDPGQLALVKHGLIDAVADSKGTAYRKGPLTVSVAGKTGTEQVYRRKPKPGEDPEQVAKFNRDHAWFAGFAPADHPQLAIVVLIEHGGAGGRYAAPIGIDVLQAYFAQAPVSEKNAPSQEK